MKSYLIYDASSGNTNRLVTCYPDKIGIQIAEGEGYVDAPEGATAASHRVVDGVPVLVPETNNSQTSESNSDDPAIIAASVRAKRDRLLAQSDWTQLPDVSAVTQAKWQQYRQALRDITDQPGFPFDVVWPEVPE